MRQKKSILRLVTLPLLFLVFSLAHATAAVTLDCSLPANAIVGVAYSGKCTASSGTTPYTYSIVPGAPLPGGLSIKASTGEISGTPTTSGPFTFSVKVDDSGTPQQTASQQLTITVTAALNITTNSLSNGIGGIAYSANCNATGGTLPYTFSISAGALPGGLSLNPANCAITGTPTTAGTFNFTITVVDSGTPQQMATQSLAIIINPALTVTSGPPPNGVVSAPYTFSLTAQNGTPPYTWSVVPGSLPPGLSLTTSAGVISGTPNTAGPFTFTVKVADSGGQTTTSQPLTITVIPALNITTTALSNGTIGIAYSASCAATGGVAPYAFSISSGSLPGGLGLNPANCAITGTPTGSGTFNFSITVADSGSPPQSNTQPLSITIGAALAITSGTPPNGVVGSTYTFTLAAQNGAAPYAWSVASGALPAGLNLTSATGVISGTPNAAGPSTFTVKIADSGGQTATQALTITIIPALNITTTSLANGIVGIGYSASCTATGGTAPYAFSISTGTLPGGLNLNPANCAISGTPNTSGTFKFTIAVTDSGTPQQTDTQSLAITINPALAITSGTPPNGVVLVGYTFTLTAQNGTPPYTWSIPAGALPAGSNLNAMTGVVSGTPTTAGPSTFTVKVADSGGQTATQPLTITIIPVLNITTSTLANGIVGIGYSASCSATGGVAPYTFSVNPASLPSGLSLNAATCAITGTATANGIFNFSIAVTDSGSPQQTNTQPLSITIGSALVITSSTPPNGAVNLPYVFTLTAQNGATPYGWSITAGALPPGVTLNGGTGTISGTPTIANTYSFTATVTDSGSPKQSKAQAFTVTIAAGLVITTTSLPNGIASFGYVTVLSATNGLAPYTWSVPPNSLPAGLSLSPAGAITGTPTVAGTFPFTVKVTDSTSPTPQTAISQPPLSITIASVLTMSNAALPGGTQGLSYSGSCSASGGTTPYNFAVTAGSLPGGLALSPSTCAITGPLAANATGSSFTVRVTDSGSPQQNVSQGFTIAIGQSLVITTSTVPNGLTGQSYTATLAAANGTKPYNNWIIASGALPSGLNLGSTSGIISGVPTAVGSYSFTVKLTDGGNPAQTAMQSFNVSVTAGLTITTSGLGTATVAVPYSATFTAQNGTPPYTWALNAGSPLPPGLTLGASTGTISGTPTTAGTYPFTVTVTDSGKPPQSALSVQFNIVVNPASAPAVPSFSFSGVPASQTPAQTISGVTVMLNPLSSAAWPITVTLGFTANAAGVPAGYADPALQFVDAGGNKQGTTYNVTVPAMASSIPLPQFPQDTVPGGISPGTVAGNISLTLTVQGQTGAISSITVPPLAPIISSVQILSVTATGFDVEIVANSSPRDLATAAFTFAAATGTQISGTSSFSVNVASVMTPWFASSTGQSYGSAFSLTVPFSFTGSSTAISSVTVTLTNSVGTSTAVTGTK